jgi:hypothetical protein
LIALSIINFELIAVTPAQNKLRAVACQQRDIPPVLFRLLSLLIIILPQLSTSESGL